MALGQISRSERETHAMDSNLTHSSRTSCFSRYELLMSVLLFCVYQPSQTLHYCHGFTWSRASCQIQAGPLLVCPGPPLTVLFSHVHLCKWRYAAQLREHRQRGEKGWQRSSVFRNMNSWIFGSIAVALAPFYKGQNICRTKKAHFFHWNGEVKVGKAKEQEEDVVML